MRLASRQLAAAGTKLPKSKQTPTQPHANETSTKPLLSAIGPAILLTATSVGAGDILTGSLAGAEAGMAALWAVPAGVILKWTLTEGIARWQMATGTTLLEGWVTRLGRWIQWVFFGYLLLFSLVTGGMLASACGVAGAALIPLGEPQYFAFRLGRDSLAGRPCADLDRRIRAPRRGCWRSASAPCSSRSR